MKNEIKVPSMGESISEALIGTILKPSGSIVKADEEILEIETDKVNQVLFAPAAGLLSLTTKTGETVKIGQVIGFVDSEGRAPPPPPEKQEIEKKKPVEEPPSPLKPAAAFKAPEPAKKEEKAETPAKTNGGESVRQTKEDFISGLRQTEPQPITDQKQEMSAPPTSKSQRETRRKMSRIRSVIAARLVEAQQTTAMLTTFNEVDFSQIMELREKYKETFTKKHGVKLGFMSFFVKATVSALKAFPDFNSYIDENEIVHREYYDIGVAVGTDKGVLVPVVRDCERLTFAEIEKSIESFASKAREGKISVNELQGGGFTITNGGVYGSLLSTPILNPSQSGILGMHKIEKRPVVVNDQIVIRPMMYLALSYDHRIVDGKEAVSFLVHIKNLLEDPSRLLLEI